MYKSADEKGIRIYKNTKLDFKKIWKALEIKKSTKRWTFFTKPKPYVFCFIIS